RLSGRHLALPDQSRQRRRDEGRGGQSRAHGRRPGRGRRPRLAEFQGRSRRGADAMTEERITMLPRVRTTPGRRLVILIPALWLAVLFLVPCLIVLKISLSQTVIAQPPYTPVLDLAAGWPGLRDFVGGLSVDSYRLLASDWLYLTSYLRS